MSFLNWFKASGDPNWANRRKIVYGTSLMCWVAFIYAILGEPDTARMTLILTHAASLLGTVITVYIGGAVVDTMNQRKFQQPPAPVQNLGPTIQISNPAPGASTKVTEPTGLASPGVGNNP